jgi:hypothetical protein
MSAYEDHIAQARRLAAIAEGRIELKRPDAEMLIALGQLHIAIAQTIKGETP